MVELKPMQQDAHHEPRIPCVPRWVAVAVTGHKHPSPSAIHCLSLKGPFNDDVGGIEIEAIASGVVHHHRMDEVPAVVAAVGKIVVARVVAVIPISDRPRRFKGPPIPGQEVVEKEAIDPRMADAKTPARNRARSEAVGVVIAGVSDAVCVNPADVDCICGSVTGIDIAVMGRGTARALEPARVA